ncbi:hypothetical protein SH580_19565 [Coraliomargarita algicola]|uniref:Beta-mannosidase-like galactose-binding domain-containing protein n=1 Tax=Coraliomargarita algicola TaxID=3092156 RepID=A0ABZ0RKU1_9BACT|nr:sugar-binding domain-containing protein [Coraliomargarita sp. J2-16]WPJ95620.1 hypothetical protein SH580_19565 [Coraliomargarita sp. J2-16]
MQNYFILLLALLTSLHASASEVSLSDGARSYVNLAGEWGVLPINGVSFDFPPPEAIWQTQQVPNRRVPSLQASTTPYAPHVKVLLNEDGGDVRRKTGIAAWFQRRFTLPEAPQANQRVLLHFGGMAFKSEVWLNGTKLGEPLLGQLPISFDVTDVLRTNGSNELLVGLSDREGLLDVAHKTYIAPASGVAMGIWGDVELQLVPSVRIDDVFVKTSVKERRLDLEVTLVNASAQSATLSVGAMITDVKQQPETQIELSQVTLAAGESKTILLSKDWIAPHLWFAIRPVAVFRDGHSGARRRASRCVGDTIWLS